MNDIFKRQFYASMMEILRDERMFYKSIVGDNYSHLRPEGEAEVLKLINFMAPQMLRIEQQELDARAKDLVTRALKE
jgi:hypothetical protein